MQNALRDIPTYLFTMMLLEDESGGEDAIVVVVWIPETKTQYVQDVELQNRLENCCTPFKVEVHCG